MQALLQPLSKLGEYEEIKNRIEKNRGILQLAGCIDSQKRMSFTDWVRKRRTVLSLRKMN